MDAAYQAAKEVPNKKAGKKGKAKDDDRQSMGS